MIAVISMLIDHIAAGILSRYLSMYDGEHSLGVLDSMTMEQWMSPYGKLYAVYLAMRMAGRIAFPIYCFLLVEGFERTKNRLKYASRLLLFAAVSELPFDLVFNGKILEFGYQNVFFTLFLGVCAMAGINRAESRKDLGNLPKQFLKSAVMLACMAAAHFLKTDYSAAGVLCITALYLFRRRKAYQIAAGCIAFAWELTAPLAFIPIWFYSGRRGWKLKYFFYLFYPMHLLALYLICLAFGISAYPAG